MCPMRFEQTRNASLADSGAAFFASPLGAALERAEMAMLRQMLDDCFGARALLLGAARDERLLDALRVERRVVGRISGAALADADADPTAAGARRQAISPTAATVVDPANLPFENDAFDVVVLFHALDLCAAPHQALREAARVLGDGGRLIVCGFNPWSLWGLRRLFGRRRAPWNAHFLSPVRMSDWLQLLDFDVNRVEFARYRPPIARGDRLFDSRPLGVMKSFVRMPFGGVWIIKAHHRALSPALPTATEAAPLDARLARGAVRGAARTPQRPAARRGNVYPLLGAHDRDR